MHLGNGFTVEKHRIERTLLTKKSTLASAMTIILISRKIQFKIAQLLIIFTGSSGLPLRPTCHCRFHSNHIDYSLEVQSYSKPPFRSSDLINPIPFPLSVERNLTGMLTF